MGKMVAANLRIYINAEVVRAGWRRNILLCKEARDGTGGLNRAKVRIAADAPYPTYRAEEIIPQVTGGRRWYQSAVQKRC